MLVFKLKQQKYTELYREHFDYACQFVWRMTKDKDLVEDIVQVSFIKLFKSLKKFKEESSLKTYFTRILINTFYDEVKRKKYEHIPIEDAQINMETENINPDDVDLYLQVATPTQRACLALFYVDGLSITEISEIMDASEGTIKSHLSRGRAVIKLHVDSQKGLA